MSNAPMPPMPGMMGGQQTPHPSFEVFRNYLDGKVAKEDAFYAFADYVTTGIKGIPLPNIDLAKSALKTDTTQSFMGYPQIIQCMGVILKNT